MIIYEDDYIEVDCLDEKGGGGAHHKYSITLKEIDSEKGGKLELCHILFQQGSILENGVSGITNEALLAIVQHRLECFMDGPFPSDYTAKALEFIIHAKSSLEARTKDRKTRGVEGKDIK